MEKRKAGTVIILAGAAVLAFGQSVSAVTAPFTEDFDADAASWRDAPGTAVLDHFSADGPDGGAYASGSFNFVSSSAGETPAILRAQDEFGSSGGAFEGDWTGGQVTGFSAFVRHNAPVDLTFFVRFSSPFNWPGAVAVDLAPIPSNTWTQLSFDITPSNPQFVTFEGSDFNGVFSNVGHIQVGVTAPPELAGSDAGYSFDIDKVSIIPEPASIILLGIGASALCRKKRWT